METPSLFPTEIGGTWALQTHLNEGDPEGVTSKVSYGPVVPGLGLVWPGPLMPALPWPGPATTTAAAQPPPAAEGGRLLLLARQARQAQARPSQGKAQQASQPSQSRILGPKGPMWSLFGDGFFKNWFETGRRGSVWRHIGTRLILPGLGTLWDASRAPKWPKLAR